MRTKCSEIAWGRYGMERNGAEWSCSGMGYDGMRLKWDTDAVGWDEAS